MVMIFTAVVNTDPGYLTNPPNNNNVVYLAEHKPLVNLLRSVECFEVCPECEIVKPSRSKHCDICEKCVGVYDHHCPWINNCVYNVHKS